MNEGKNFVQLYCEARSTCYRALKDLNDYNKDHFKSYTRCMLDRMLESLKYGSSLKSYEKRAKQGERLVISLEDRCKRVDELLVKMGCEFSDFCRNYCKDMQFSINANLAYSEMTEALKKIFYGREIISNALNAIKSSKEPIEKILERDAIAKAVMCFSDKQ